MVFEIWTEGYLCTGMEGAPQIAQKIGECEGDNFREAVTNFLKTDVGQEWDTKQYPFNFIKLSHWGCGWFDNEHDARKAFG